MRSLRGSSCPFRCASALAALLMVMCGCGRPAKQPKPVPVTGQVLYEGRPLPRAQLTFIPLGDANTAQPRPSAVTDEDGRFVPTTFRERDGAPEGEYVVLVQWRPLLAKGEDVTPGENALSARYSDPRQSPLKVQVSAGRLELEPLQISRN